MSQIIACRDIFKDYARGKLTVPVLKHVTFTVQQGEYIAIMGPSGSGKTTLMNIIGCLDVPTSGTFLLDGEEKTLLWECAGDDLDELVKDKLVEFHIDRVEVLYGLMLEIQGWTTDQRGNVEVTVHKENMELLDCKITRGRLSLIHI